MKKVFDKRNLKLLERLLENQGVSLKKDNTLNEVSLSKRLSSFKQAVVGSTGEDAWKDAWDIASSGMSDPEAEKQLYQAAAEWWHSTGKLKKEEAPVSNKEKADQLMQQVASLGLTDLQSNTKALLDKLAGMLADKPPEETEKAIDNIKKVAQDGELDATDVAAVAKEVPADAEPAVQEPELRLSLRNDGVNVKGILKYLSDHPRVNDEQVKAMAKYFKKIIPGNLIMFERVTGTAPSLKKKKVVDTPYKNIVDNPVLKKNMKMLTGPSEVGDVLSKILKMASQLKKAEKQSALKAAAAMSGGVGKKKQTKQAPVPLTTDTGPIKNLVDTMSSLKIPDDIIEKVFDALDDQLQGKAPVHESINKKRKVVIRYGKSKAKKEKS